ncbi:hypothetical protein Lalb_Chr11g0072111 [Lupinus albus]|uniref:Transmembrane protein n=1 Tax=Lupinus albus TaxID=3870 RepID=A0A6A4PSG2_LUPAL|nr:hypothetical protein Lalb_Chr11g0072111 [Lupinus albus]
MSSGPTGRPNRLNRVEPIQDFFRFDVRLEFHNIALTTLPIIFAPSFFFLPFVFYSFLLFLVSISSVVCFCFYLF